MWVRCAFWMKPQPELHVLGFKNKKLEPQPHRWFRFQNFGSVSMDSVSVKKPHEKKEE